MWSSRRSLLRFCGIGSAIAVAGCIDSAINDVVGDASSDTEPTASDVDAESSGDPVADDAPLRVTLTIDETRSFFEGRHVETVGQVREGQRGVPYVSLQMTDEGLDAATETAVAADLGERYGEAEIVVFVNDEEQNRFGVDSALASAIVDGEWPGEFRMTFTSRESAETFRETLITGST